MPAGDAKRIRDYATEVVEEERHQGKTSVTIRSGDIHDALRLRMAHANVGQVLDGSKFHNQANVKLVGYTGPNARRGSNAKFTFEILERERHGSVEESLETVSVLQRVSKGERIARLEAQVEMLIWELDEVKKDIRHLRRI